jgi:hypothetical protein
MRNRVRYWDNGVEPENPFFVTVYDGSSICLVPTVIVLYVVFTVAIRLPDVYFDTFNWLAGCGFHSAEYKEGVTVRVGRYGEAILVGWGIVRMERSQYGAFSRVRRLGVVNGVDEERETNDIREQDELLHSVTVWKLHRIEGLIYLPYVCTYLPHGSKKLDSCHPFVKA